jgi:hypothetical protein
MQSATGIFLTYFAAELLLFLAAYFTGHLFLGIFSGDKTDKFYASVFFRLLFGATILVFIVSIGCTIGCSICFLFLAIFVFWLIEKRISRNFFTGIKKDNFKILFSLKQLPGIIFLISIIFCWQASVILKHGAFPIHPLEKDSFFYSEIAKCMISTGCENTFTTANLADNNYHFHSPYHYFDIWLCAFTGKALNLNYTLCLLLVVYSFFTTVLLFGFLACIEYFKLPGLKEKVAVFFLLFIGGMYVTEDVLNWYQYQAQMEGVMVRYGGKLAAAYCFALAAIIYFCLKKNTQTAFFLLLCLPAISISLAPGVFGGIFLYSLFQFFKRSPQKKFYLRLLTYVLLICAMIALFYKVLNKTELNYRLDKPLQEYTDLTAPSWFRIKFYLVELFLKTYAHPLLFALNYFPFALLLAYLLIKKLLSPEIKSSLFLFSLIWFCALIAFNTFYLMDDAYQLFINTLVIWVILFGFCFIWFNYNTSDNGYIKPVLNFIFLGAAAFNIGIAWHSYKKIDPWENQFSTEYLTEVNHECDKFTAPTTGATFYDPAYFNDPEINYPLEYYCQPFTFNPKVYTPFNLTPPDIPQTWNKHQIEKNLSKSPFTQYLKEQNRNGNIKDTLSHQLDFIRLHKIKYLICPKNMDIAQLNSLSIKKVISDSGTGQRFLILN